MKKKILILSISILAIWFTGCSEIRIPNTPTLSLDYKEIEARKIINALRDNDKDRFKDLFCNMTKASENFDEQIDEAMEFVGEIKEKCNYDVVGSEGMATDDGKVTSHDISPYITNIETEDKGTFTMWCDAYLVNEDTNKEGIYYMRIESDDGYQCEIGER
jgi:biotin synthase-like enzyme